MRKTMDEYLLAYEQMGYFSGTVLVAKDGEVVLHEGYGAASREHDVKNKADTVFRLASVSKLITAAAVMILHEQGLIDLDQPIQRYLPDFPNGDKITVHHLLTHTSGLPRPAGLNVKANMKLDQVVQKFIDKPLAFEPGEKFEYVNSGYILLTRLIESVSGTSYEQFLQRHFLAR